jgi:hypothetical protein
MIHSPPYHYGSQREKDKEKESKVKETENVVNTKDVLTWWA